MRYAVLFLVLALLQAPDAANWKVVWSDEFNGTSLDQTVWGHETGYCRNQELQYYTINPQNVFMQNGNLVIQTLIESMGGYAYTSASLLTRGKKSWTYGRFEIRAKLPYGAGIWPAFWSCGTVDGWPVNGEIDIFELWGGGSGDRSIMSTLHYGANNTGQSVYYNLSSGKFADAYHTFACEWDSTQIKFYCDTILESNKAILINTPDMVRAFTQPHYFWLNTAVSDPIAATQQFIIDYARFYQLEKIDSTQQVYMPLVTPWGGPFLDSVLVTIACRTSGSQIYYTDNSATPDSNATQYTGPFKISSTTVIKARAYKMGLTKSDTAMVTFTKVATGAVKRSAVVLAENSTFRILEGTTSRSFTIASPVAGFSFSVFNVLGRELYRSGPASPDMTNGDASIEWNGRTTSGTFLGRGIYFVQFRSGTTLMTQRLVIEK
jgi:beta-glucanase (GH16 family)